MDRISEVKFSDLQNDERYKKLERALKLSYLKKGFRLDESWPLPMSPSMSGINVDTTYVNSNVPESRASRIGSVIVSSSNNLRNVVLKKDVKNSHQTMCTSSVKDFNSTNGLQEDYFMMPPPNSNFISSASNKANSTPLSNVLRTAPAFHSKCANKQSPNKTNSSSLQISPNNATQHAKNSIRIFTGWKVALNEQGQLVILGTINGWQLARSKPIVRRLTLTKIQSLCNHVYQLEGIIFDKDCELPDYVRGKFYNGFPDDWKNVHQIWHMYKQQGSRPTFRWPTPLADSDDDLRTELTDFTFTSIDSMNVSTMHRNKENLNVQSLNKSKINQQNTNKEHSKESATAVAEYPYQDNKINKLKDTFNIIVNNIADKNCPQEFVGKIVEMFDSLKYFVSYGSSKENESNTESSTLEQDKSVVREQRKDVRNDKSSPSNNGIDFNKSKCKNTDIHPDKRTASNNYSLNSRKSAIANNCTDTDSSNSESEVYIGIPKIPAERILRQRETLMKTYKRTTRPTKHLRRHCDVSEKKQTSSNNTENINHMYFDDSSVSIIRNLTDFSEVETNSKVENNVNKDVNLGTKEMNPCEMKELVQENLTTLYEVTENCSDISHVNESNARKINETLENENAISKTNFRGKTLDKQSYDVLNNNYQASNNTSKPVVLNSVPINIKIMYQGVKQTRNVDRDSKGSEKEVQHLKTNGKSPVKTPNALRNINSDSSNYSVRKEHERSRKLIQLDHTRICGDKQDNGIKAEKLSSWSPKLICEPELCLCFEGKLLNDAGHIVNRRFETDAVLRRVSLNVVETISYKFYELVGDFNNHKDVIPKQLLNQCRHGCPTRINMFCKTWKSLQNNSKTENELGTTDIRMSSRGRKMMRPLSYWAGERFSVKQNNSVYSPGFDQDPVTKNMSKTFTNSMKETIKQQNNSNQENDSKELKQSPNTNNKSIVNGMEKVEGAKSEERVVRRKKKKRPEPRLSNSNNTTDGKTSPVKKRQRFMKNLQELNTSDDEKKRPRKLRKNSLENKETKRKIRSNATPIMSPVRVKKISMNRYSPSAGNRYSESYSFCRNKSQWKKDETLSEDQESYVQ